MVVFPEFKKVQITDRIIFESVTKNFSPYCDFNFSNVYNWSSPSKPTEFSLLNGNLVIKMKDFTSNKLIVSILGKNKILESIKILLGYYDKLTLVPEEVLSNNPKIFNTFEIEEDINNNDYILDLQDLVNLKGSRFKSKRAWVHRFENNYPDHYVRILDVNKKEVLDELVTIFRIWQDNKKLSDDDVRDEFISLTRFLKVSNVFKIICVVLYVREKPVGFTINEGLKDGVANGSFGKSDINYICSYQYLEHITAKKLIELDYQFLNYEQDLGIKNLRKSKLSWRPVKFLKKYNIGKKFSQVT